MRMTYNNFFIFPAAVALLILRKLLRRSARLAAPSHDPDAYQVEMEPAPPLLNRLLTWIGQLEAALLRWIDLPAGTGLLALARKPAAPVSQTPSPVSLP
jgi:hypothetical protein